MKSGYFNSLGQNAITHTLVPKPEWYYQDAHLLLANLGVWKRMLLDGEGLCSVSWIYPPYLPVVGGWWSQSPLLSPYTDDLSTHCGHGKVWVLGSCRQLLLPSYCYCFISYNWHYSFLTLQLKSFLKIELHSSIINASYSIWASFLLSLKIIFSNICYDPSIQWPSIKGTEPGPGGSRL